MPELVGRMLPVDDRSNPHRQRSAAVCADCGGASSLALVAGRFVHAAGCDRQDVSLDDLVAGLARDRTWSAR